MYNDLQSTLCPAERVFTSDAITERFNTPLLTLCDMDCYQINKKMALDINEGIKPLTSSLKRLYQIGPKI